MRRMARKHIVLIHGRSTKPRREEKLRYVRLALLAGLRHVSAEAAALVERGTVPLTLAYYGDLSNEIMVRAQPEKKATMVETRAGWFEPDGCDDEGFDRLLRRPPDAHTQRDYDDFLETVKDRRYRDDFARVMSPLLALIGLSSRAIMKIVPDLGSYLTSRVVGSAMRERLQGPLQHALDSGDEVALVAHSMGCIVAYDVLWKFSRMSEYRRLWERRVGFWLTLGSPLGDTAVLKELYDAHEPEDGRYPRNIGRWVNIAAHDDFVAHDPTARNDFEPMLNAGLLESIEDERVFTFWEGRNGANPHKLYGYLYHPRVAARIAGWLVGDAPAAP